MSVIVPSCVPVVDGRDVGFCIRCHPVAEMLSSSDDSSTVKGPVGIFEDRKLRGVTFLSAELLQSWTF